jgi:hypothetical protein
MFLSVWTFVKIVLAGVKASNRVYLTCGGFLVRTINVPLEPPKTDGYLPLPGIAVARQLRTD